jgi:4-amino-4-deoxy-L-arabinose transferase-like glycosyltransferase
MWSGQARNIRQAVPVWAVACLCCALAVWVGWIGFLGSDDALYAEAARAWLEHGPTLGSSHWSLRLPIVLPVAASFSVFGIGEFSLILPTLIYALVVGILFVFIARAALGWRDSLFAVLPFVTAPIFAQSASIPGIDLTELAFDVASIYLLVLALNASERRIPLLLSGVFAGLAYMSRETSIFLAVGYGVLFLTGFRMDRRQYLYIVAGFLLVAGAEMAVYYFLTGSPFYRLNISFHHDEVNRNISKGLFDGAGNLHTGSILDPFLMLFLNKDFGILFWLAVPATIWFVRARTIPRLARDGLLVFAVVGLAWMLSVCVLAAKLYLLTRYFLVPFAAAALLIGAWLAYGIFPRSPRLAWGIVVIAVSINILACFLSNNDLMFPARRLVSYARTTNALIYTDGQTERRAQFLLEANGLGNRVTSAQHRLGDVFFYVPANSGLKERGAGYDLAVAARYKPLPGEREVARFSLPRRFVARVFDSLGLSKFVPAPIMAKLAGNETPVFVYRAAGAGRGP